MRCERCGAELSENGYCPVCGADSANEGHVQVLSRAERNAYTGITIEEGTTGDTGPSDVRFERRKGNGWSGFSYMTNGVSWQGKLTMILVVAAILCFVFFIALPVAIVAILFSIVSWFLYRLLY